MVVAGWWVEKRKPLSDSNLTKGLSLFNGGEGGHLECISIIAGRTA